MPIATGLSRDAYEVSVVPAGTVCRPRFHAERLAIDGIDRIKYFRWARRCLFSSSIQMTHLYPFFAAAPVTSLEIGRAHV